MNSKVKVNPDRSTDLRRSVNIHLPWEDFDRLYDRAQREERSISTMAGILIRKGLDTEGTTK